MLLDFPWAVRPYKFRGKFHKQSIDFSLNLLVFCCLANQAKLSILDQWSPVSQGARQLLFTVAVHLFAFRGGSCAA